VPFATIGETTIHFESAGSGFPLVLLHGLGSNARSWSRQLEDLSKDFLVIAWDAPGYGRSSDPAGTPTILYYAQRLRELLDALSLPEVFLLGQSMGGVIAQEFYRTHSQYVKSLILSDTSYGGPKSRLEERLRKIRTLTPAELAAERAPQLLSASAPQPVLSETIDIMSEIRPAGYEFAAIALAEANTRGALERIRVPLLLIWGENDTVTPMWTELPAGAELVVIAGAGHLCNAEQPARFNDAVRKFLLNNSRG
jgi:pimeloyl-ACP methyl ester carboxylesterase